jgi:hypothetical protein
MNTDSIRRDDWILGGLALALVVALFALPWLSFGGGGTVGGFTIPSYDLSGTSAPDGWLGILSVLAALALIADLAVERLSPQTALPSIGGSREMTRFVLAAAAGVFIALKILFHISLTFSNLGFGFPVDVVLAAGLVYFAIQARESVPASVPTPPAPSPAGPAGSAGPPVS